MRIELVRSVRVGGVEAEEWDENRRFGVVAEATGRIITKGLGPMAFYPDEEEKVHEFLEGVKLARNGRADAFFVPPLPGDDGTWTNYPLMQGIMEDHKRSYVVICGEGPGKQVYCAPAIVFAEDEEEDVEQFLGRMGELLGDRFFVLPQKVFMKEIGWERGRLDEFDMVVLPDEGYRRRSLRRGKFDVKRLKESAIRGSVFRELINEEAVVGHRKSYEDLWEFLGTTTWGGETLMAMARAGAVEKIKGYVDDEESRRVEGLVPDEVNPGEAGDYIDMLLERGCKIEGINAPLEAKNVELVGRGKRPVVLQAVGPGGAVVMLPFYAGQDVVKRICEKL